MECSKCGKELPKDALFCNQCGNKVEKIDECSHIDIIPSKVSPKNDFSQTTSSIIIEESKKESNRAKRESRIQEITIICIILVIAALAFIPKGISIYLKNKNRASIERYGRERFDWWDSKSSPSKSSSSEYIPPTSLYSDYSSIQKEMEDIADAYDKNLPIVLGDGITMKSCKVLGKDLVHLIESKNASPNDIDSYTISEMESQLTENIREGRNDPHLKYQFDFMKEYGYDYVYRFVNERGVHLFDVRVSSDKF